MHLVRKRDNNNTRTCIYNMHKKAWHRLLLSRESLPCQSQTPPTLFPSFSPHPLLPWVCLSLLHHPFLSSYASITPSSPGYALTVPSPLLSWVRLFLFCHLPLLWVCFPLLHHPLSFSCGYAFSCSVTPFSSHGYASLCSRGYTSLCSRGYGSLCSVTPLSCGYTSLYSVTPSSSGYASGYTSLCSALDTLPLACLPPHRALPDVEAIECVI